MVGVRTWNITEIIWILDKWRDRCKIQSLMDQYTAQFPDSSRNSNSKTLRTGIQYVWDKYNKDPSYNHYFSDDEIWFIMVKSLASNGTIIREVLRIFKKAFPDHDWNMYVDEPLAIEATIAKYQHESPYCVQWQHDEVHFVLSKKLTTENWDELLAAFQAWRQRKDVTVKSLQYLCESRQLSKRHEADEEEDVMLDTTHHHPNELPDVARKLTKRKREMGGEQHQNKRLLISQQQPGFMGQGNQIGPHSNNMSRSLDWLQWGNSGLPGPHHQKVPLYVPRTDTGIYLPGTALQQQNPTGEDCLYLANVKHSSSLDRMAAMMHVSQHDPPIPPPWQAQDPRYPVPNVMPQELMYYGRDQPHLVTPVQNTPALNVRPPWGCFAYSFSRPATCSNGAPSWPPRFPWNRNNFRSINVRTGSVTEQANSSTFTSWCGPQAMVGGNSGSEPGMGDGDNGSADIEDPSERVGVTHVGVMQQMVPIIADSLRDFGAGENEILISDRNVLPEHTDFSQLGGVQGPEPARSIEVVGIIPEEEQQIYQPAIDALIWQSGLPSDESWLASISTTPDDIFSVPSTKMPQQFYPDTHTMGGHCESQSPEIMLAPAPKKPGDLRGVLEIEGNQLSVRERDITSDQSTMDSNGSLSDRLETGGYQDPSFPSTQPRQIEDFNLLNGAFREQRPAPVEAENFSACSLIENGQDSLGFMTMSKAAVRIEDEFLGAPLAIEPGGYEDFLYFGNFDPTNVDEFLESKPEAHESAFSVIELADPQVLRQDDPKKFEQPDLSTIETFVEAERSGVTIQVSLTNAGRLQVSSEERNTYLTQCASDEGWGHELVASNPEDGEDAQASKPYEMSRLSGSGSGDSMDSVAKWLPSVSNSMTEGGTADISTETGAVGEKYVPSD